MCHVLIIEDEWLTADYLASLAERAGATSVALAFTESEAVHAAYERPPDIIFSDVSLAEGTGPCAVRTILAALGDIPVIFITATPDVCAQSGVPGAVLSKPVNPIRLLDMVRCLAPPGGAHA